MEEVAAVAGGSVVVAVFVGSPAVVARGVVADPVVRCGKGC